MEFLGHWTQKSANEQLFVVILGERYVTFTYGVSRPSSVCLSSVVFLSVTLLRHGFTQTAEVLGSIFTLSNSLRIQQFVLKFWKTSKGVLGDRAS